MQQKTTILLVDDEDDVLLALKMLLKRHFGRVFSINNPEHLPRALEQYQPDVVLLDMNFNRGDTTGEAGMACLLKIRQSQPETPVIMMTAYSAVETAVAALKNGATDFVEKPWRNERLLTTVHAALDLAKSKKQVAQLQSQQQILSETMDSGFGDMLGQSEPMQKVFKTIEKVAATDASVLILGENGTGKEVVARALHRLSARSKNIFIGVDLGAIPTNLFESELFGYKKGAFTGADSDKPGRFEAANGGTLFLDEIGNLELAAQHKLLAVLENRQVVRVGSNLPKDVDIRLICATNMPLQSMVEEKIFRQDLLYRMNTVEINLPPLRERYGDISILAEHFLQIYGKRYNRSALKLHKTATTALENWSWPGNVRELRHTMERAVILSEQDLLTEDDFNLSTKNEQTKVSFDTLNLEEMEKVLISQAMQKHKGNISKAAEALGLTRAALYRRMEKHNI